MVPSTAMPINPSRTGRLNVNMIMTDPRCRNRRGETGIFMALPQK
jgi:hypothetical protein